MVPELASFYNDQDLGKLRFIRPLKFIFLCGGPISADPITKALSLRDYLYRIKRITKDLAGNIVLAEAANQLYRDTSYGDLISFEEDVARIASIVLVITESPGSLAELGAFATNDTIRGVLRVIMQERFNNEESFIRFGPIERIMNEDRGFIGIYPWKVRDDHVIISSIASEYPEIVSFINRQLGAVPTSILFPVDRSLRIFYVTYWIIFILLAVSTTTLYRCVTHLLPDTRSADIKKQALLHGVGWLD